MLTFRLLGRVELHKDGVPLTRFRSQKEIAILVYLAHVNQACQRSFFADLLWEGRSRAQTLGNLRTALARIRKNAGDDVLITRTSVTLAPESQPHVDSVVLLETLATIGRIDSAEKAAALQRAVAAYAGDFLPHFDLPDAPQFDEWVTTTRQYILRQVIAAYEKLVRYAVSSGDVAGGIVLARRWLELDELDETAHTLLIRLLIEQGSMSEATAHYVDAADLLRTTFGTEPPAEMTALIERIRPNPPSAPRQATVQRHNLPPLYNQSVDRTIVKKEIHARLDQPWCRLVTLVGQGGVGKTRLATDIARSRLGRYADGVWLVELADIDPDDAALAEAIAVEIATALDLRLMGSATPTEQLLNHLQHKQMLLVLDNIEHVLGGVPIVLDLIARCENVQLLVTSREALEIRAEWSVALPGLTYPASDTDESPSDAVELFTVRRAQHRWEPISAENLTAIRQICRTVEGLPLAIELAAALTRDRSAQAVAAELRDSFDALTASLRDVPQRHRSLRVVFDMSWHTLTPALQQRLARLALFRGGFTAAAAQRIADATEPQLAALGDKSLLAHDPVAGRYTLHAVVRAYAAEQRAPGDQTRQKHARYYLNALARHTEPLQKEAPHHSVEAIMPDIDNVRLAWRTGLADRDAARLWAALTPLSLCYQMRGLAHEGEATMQRTIKHASTWGREGVVLATRAGVERARFQNRLGHCRLAIQSIKAALKLAAQAGDRWAEGMAHVWWGEALWRLGEYDSAEKKLIHALNIAHAIDATLIIGWCHHQLGIVHDLQSRYAAAHDHLEKACAAWRALDNTLTLSVSLNSIGLVLYHQGDLPAADAAWNQSLVLCNQIDYRHLKSILLNNLSIIAIERGHHSEALHYLHSGLELAVANGNLSGQADTFINLGKNFRLMGETDLAVANLEQALQICQAIGQRSSEAPAMLALARTERDRGNHAAAKSWCDQALAIARQDKLQRIECEVLIGLAEILRDSDPNKARQYSAEAITLAQAIGNSLLYDLANDIYQALSASADAGQENPVV